MKMPWRRERPPRPPRPAGDPNPFETYMLAACLLQGVAVLSGRAKPTSIHEALPPVLRLVWAGTLACGGLLALVGLFWRGDPFTGVEVKKVGLVATAGGTLAYGAAAIAYGPLGAAIAIFNISFALACLIRVHQVNRRIKDTRRYLRSAQKHAAALDCIDTGEPERGSGNR